MNTWQIGNKTASDSTHEAIYNGTVAKEIWYKGEKIWDRVANFWRFAHPSQLGEGVFSAPWRWWLYRKDADETEWHEITPTFSLSNEFFHDALGIEEKTAQSLTGEGDHFYPPAVGDARGKVEITATQIDMEQRKVTVSVRLLQDIPTRREFGYLYQGGWPSAATYYEKAPPFVTVYVTVEVMPGTYTLKANGRASRVTETHQFVWNNTGWQRFTYISFSNIYGAEIDHQIYNDSLGNDYVGSLHSDSSHSVTVNVPGILKFGVELGVDGGAAGSERTYSIALTGYADGYSTIVRPGQLRGTFIAENGATYTFVVNDSRALYPGQVGERNVNPTMCIDPETGAYVEAKCTGIIMPKEPKKAVNIFSGSTYTPADVKEHGQEIGRYSMYTGSATINVYFYERYVYIKKGSYEMKLRYGEGSESYALFYGG